jgi:hypothetical protein
MLGMFLIGGSVLLVMLIIGLIMLGLLSFVFWIWMLIDSIKNENLTSNEKVAWVLAIVLTHWLRALIYFFAGRPRRKSSAIPAMA